MKLDEDAGGWRSIVVQKLNEIIDEVNRLSDLSPASQNAMPTTETPTTEEVPMGPGLGGATANKDKETT